MRRNYKSLNYPKTSFFSSALRYVMKMTWKVTREKSFSPNLFSRKLHKNREWENKRVHAHIFKELLFVSNALDGISFPFLYTFINEHFHHDPAGTAVAAALPLGKKSPHRSEIMKTFFDCAKDLSSQQLAFE